MKLLASLFLSLVCSTALATGSSDNVTIAVVPNAPIVIASDITVSLYGRDTLFKAPWFYANYKITNDSDKRLSVVLINTQSYGEKNGQKTSALNTFTTHDETASGIIVNIDAHSSEVVGYWFDNNAESDSGTLDLEVTFGGWFSDMNKTKMDADEHFTKVISFQTN